MTDEKMEDVLFDINGKLASIETKLDAMSENILKHEARLTNLETTITKHISECNVSKEDTFKTDMLKLLGKCLVIGLTVIASLTGAGSLLVKIIQQ